MMIDKELQAWNFWKALDRLVAGSEIIIEQRRGSRHLDYPNLTYPLDVGYLRETRSSNGDKIDIWLGSLEQHKVEAIILNMDLKKRKTEVKLLVGCSQAEKLEILKFSNRNHNHAKLVERDDFQTWLRSRRSVRRFQERPVPIEVLRRVLETACWAPSAHNRQPWRFAVLQDSKNREALAERMGRDLKRDLIADKLPLDVADRQVARSKSRIVSSPAAIILCMDPACLDHYPDTARQHAEYLMGVQSTALAGGTLLLAAHAAGLAGVWMCAPLFTPASVRQVLNLPESWQPQALILLGYAEGYPEPPSRLSLDEITLFL